MHITRPVGFLAFILFLACIPTANWLIQHVGTVCVPNGPCLIPVAPGLVAPSGVALIGLALVLRDVVQRCLGKYASLIAIALGTALSTLIAPPALVLASAVAFFLSEIADFAIYTPLAQRRLVTAVIASALVGLVVDSVVFLFLAFGSLDYLAGQVVGKTWAVLISIPFIRLLRRAAPTPA
ncbi:MAG: VUT family protein [Acetobacteraceae bacterium]|nr:VUT family protein [Acetobacteraceae bacterium]MSP30054.1 VUT family protein [Acetobacteraceae bacterium]